jgi:hypothetical protein
MQFCTYTGTAVLLRYSVSYMYVYQVPYNIFYCLLNQSDMHDGSKIINTVACMHDVCISHCFLLQEKKSSLQSVNLIAWPHGCNFSAPKFKPFCSWLFTYERNKEQINMTVPKTTCMHAKLRLGTLLCCLQLGHNFCAQLNMESSIIFLT